jgi:outer membrane lipoprotein SlyB
MVKKPLAAMLMATMLVPSLAPVEAQARKHYQTYRGSDGRYYRCKRSNGTTGTIAGGAGGALIAGAAGASTLGTVAAGVGGALLGRTLDKRHDRAQNRRNGC